MHRPSFTSEEAIAMNIEITKAGDTRLRRLAGRNDYSLHRNRERSLHLSNRAQRCI
jgi:hypothetical protein